MDKERRLKDEIIKFVQDSPEDVNSELSIFIAGMQAQKNLMGNRQETDNGFTVIKNTGKKVGR